MKTFTKETYSYIITHNIELITYLVQHYTFVYVLAVQWNAFGLGY